MMYPTVHVLMELFYLCYPSVLYVTYWKGVIILTCSGNMPLHSHVLLKKESYMCDYDYTCMHKITKKEIKTHNVYT